MTEFVKVRINLQHLATGSRMRALDSGKDKGQVPLQIGVKIEPVPRAVGGDNILDSLKVAVTLPDAVAEPSVSLGTSVFAAGQIALKMGKNWLTRAGLSQAELDGIGIANVELETAAMTYLLPANSSSQTALLMRGIHQHGLLLGLITASQPTLNRTTYRAAVSDAADPLVGTALVLDWRTVQCHLCLHVSLATSYLERQKWTALESWRAAYDENRYKLIFDKVVRGMLRLDGKVSAHPEPRSECYDHLGISDAELLREHIAGRDGLSYGGFPMCAPNKEKSDAKACRAARLRILTICGVDIRKPWSSYRVFRPRLLMKTLRYPGDYCPPNPEVDLRFCKENWPYLLELLN